MPSFIRLWQGVVVDQASQGPPQEDVPPVAHVCQFGMSNATLEAARYLLGRAEPPIEALEVDDTDAESGAPREAAALLAQLEAEFPGRVRPGARSYVRPGVPGTPRLHSDEWAPCDFVMFSEAAPRFSLERILTRLRSHVVVALVSHPCVMDEEEIPTPRCNLVNVLWEKTPLVRWGYCVGAVCMSRVPSWALQDPNTLPLDCERFASEEGSSAGIAEFGQDWYLYWNWLRRGREGGLGGVYVDVGASLPFEYSNTVLFDRCLGWRGVCVEPNPHLVAFLEAYRSCEVVPKCVSQDRARGRAFSDRDGTLAFHASCAPLGEILTQAGLRGQRIDVLSIDVEHGELSVLRGLPLDEFDVRLMVIEVTQGARWLEVDTAVLPYGYAKVAVLGRDVVYVKLEELVSAGLAADWPLLQGPGPPRAVLPHNWAAFHQRVVDEELEQEMRREKELTQRGLRRR